MDWIIFVPIGLILAVILWIFVVGVLGWLIAIIWPFLVCVGIVFVIAFIVNMFKGS